MYLDILSVLTQSNKRNYIPIPDIVSDVLIKEDGVLRYDANGLSKRILGDFGDILSVDEDASVVHVVKPEQKTNDGGFAAARGTHESHGRPERSGETGKNGRRKSCCKELEMKA